LAQVNEHDNLKKGQNRKHIEVISINTTASLQGIDYSADLKL